MHTGNFLLDLTPALARHTTAPSLGAKTWRCARLRGIRLGGATLWGTALSGRQHRLTVTLYIRAGARALRFLYRDIEGFSYGSLQVFPQVFPLFPLRLPEVFPEEPSEIISEG